MLLCNNDRVLDDDLNFECTQQYTEQGITGIQEISYCTFIKLKSGVCVVGLKHPSTIFFRGIVEVLCLKGNIEILGHVIKSGEAVEAFSLLGSSAMYISTTENSHSSDVYWNHLISEEYDFNKIKTINDEVGSEGVLLILTSKFKKYDHWRRMFDNSNIKLFPDYRLVKGPSLFMEAEKSLECIFDHYLGTRIDRKVIVDRSWDNYVISSDSSVDYRLMICGGNGFGKSTLLRYLVNRTLLLLPEVLIIDLDIGQAEMNMHSCICCHVVSKPLLGPNFTHLRQPKWSICIGKVDPTRCFSDYIKAVQELINKCNSDRSLIGLPWIVNTMGFSRGIGVTLTCAAIKVLHPTTILMLNSEEEQLKPLNFSQSLINNSITSSVIHSYLSENFPCDVTSIKAPIDSIFRGPFFHANKISSRKLREAVELVYFSENCCCVTLRVQSKEQKSNHWKESQPSEIVSLCKPDGYLSCIGFGKVISVDHSIGELNIITPINTTNLLNENAVTVVGLGSGLQKTNTIIHTIEPISGENNTFLTWRRALQNLDTRAGYAYNMFSVCID